MPFFESREEFIVRQREAGATSIVTERYLLFSNGARWTLTYGDGTEYGEEAPPPEDAELLLSRRIAFAEAARNRVRDKLIGFKNALSAQITIRECGAGPSVSDVFGPDWPLTVRQMIREVEVLDSALRALRAESLQINSRHRANRDYDERRQAQRSEAARDFSELAAIQLTAAEKEELDLKQAAAIRVETDRLNNLAQTDPEAAKFVAVVAANAISRLRRV